MIEKSWFATQSCQIESIIGSMAPSLCYPTNLSVPAPLLTAVSMCHATIARRVWIHGISLWFNRVIRGVNPRLANRIDCPGTSFFSQSLPSERVWGCCAKDVRSLKFSDCRLHLQSGKVRVVFSRIFTAFRVAKRKCHKWSASTFRRRILVRRSPRADHEDYQSSAILSCLCSCRNYSL